MELNQSKKKLQDTGTSCSQPLHVKRIEKALELKSFMHQFLNNKTESSDEDSSDIVVDDDSKRTTNDNVKLDSVINGIFSEVLCGRISYYNNFQIPIHSITRSSIILAVVKVIGLGCWMFCKKILVVLQKIPTL